MEYRELLNEAIKVKKMAYAPYSNVNVGAALLTQSGRVFTGVNVENASFGATNCAERTAIYKAVTEGERDYIAIAVASNLDHVITPCGICRQVLVEFNPQVDVVLGDENEMTVHKISDLLPLGFNKTSVLTDKGGKDGV